MRRLPPQHTEDNFSSLGELIPELYDSLLQEIDQPLQLSRCSKTGREFLSCDHNRDADSHRSPWSNEYEPPLEDGQVPTPRLRKLEVALNDAFDTYRSLYFEGGVSSVYVWKLDNGFCSAVLFKKVTEGTERRGAWDSIHLVETYERGRQAHYKITSTVLLYLLSSSPSSSETGGGKGTNLNLAGSLTDQKEYDMSVDDMGGHVSNVGEIVETMESRMRGILAEVYFDKTCDIIGEVRSVESLTELEKRRQVNAELTGKLQGRASSADI